MSAFDRGITAGVIGVGRLGAQHARVYSAAESVDSVLVYDRIDALAREVAGVCGAAVCATVGELLDRCDVVSICTPATNHHETAGAAFDRGVHVLVEKPIAASSAEGRDMVKRARERGCVLQVGHIERFNGAYQAACPLLTNPLFIESHRLATFTPRGTDVSVVADLMIHDIDLVLDVLNRQRMVDLRASGTGVLTDSADMVNARMEFEGGCVANITASRISREPMRKIRFFQENLYVSIDLKGKSVDAFEKAGDIGVANLDADPSAFIRKLDVAVDTGEPLEKEISSFLEAVAGGSEPVVTGEEGLSALGIAERILARVVKGGGKG